MVHLSKSKYCDGVQCPKMLWLKKYCPEEFDSSVLNQAVLDTGNEVGDLAMGIFCEYTEVPFSENLGQMLEDTDTLMKQGVRTICEASFAYEGCFCSVDILVNLGEGKVKLYEVKSSTKMDDRYFDDVAYQNYVLTKLGYEVEGAYLVHLDNTYVRHGELELDKLFCMEDLTENARSRFEQVENNIAMLGKILAESDEPEKDIGEQCFAHYSCGYFKHCTSGLPHPNVFDLSGVQTRTQLKCYRMGKVSYEDLLAEKKLVNDKARQQIRHEMSEIPADIDVEAIRAFLDTLSYPLYFLDFESFAPAIPQFDDSKPYQQICFQYSLHYIEEEGGEVKHKEFLAYPGVDPRRKLCEALSCDIPENVCTLVFNQSFEKTRIKEMAELYPDLYEHLMNIHDNIRDLMVPFRDRSYYCRAMAGSFSIKYVLPALFPDDPELDYHNLEGVHNGSEASAMFARMATMEPEELERNRAHLLKYCGLDTLATVKVWQKLVEVAG